MTEIEELRAEVETLKKKLEDREMRLIRAWNGLVRIRGELQRFSAPHAYETPKKSFEEQADILAMGVTGMIQSYREKLCRMIESGRRIQAHVGREPESEEQRADVALLKKSFDLALMGLEEGKPYEGFYDGGGADGELSKAGDAGLSASTSGFRLWFAGEGGSFMSSPSGGA